MAGTDDRPVVTGEEVALARWVSLQHARAARGEESRLSSRDQALISIGRHQANSAINWDTSCLGCADRLDRLYAERCAGAEDAARAIEVALRAAYAQSGDRALLEAAAIVRAYGNGRPEHPADATGEPEAPQQ